MLEIYVTNTESYLRGDNGSTLDSLKSVLTPGQHSALLRVLTITDKGAYFTPAYRNGYWDGTVSFIDNKRKAFPTGLLPLVIKELAAYDVQFKVFDRRKNKDLIPNFKRLESGFEFSAGKKARDYQSASYNALAFHKVYGERFPRGIIGVATNGGKTGIATMILHSLRGYATPEKPLLFIVHKRGIAIQAAKSFEEALGEKVGMIVGNKETEPRRITVCTSSLLASRLKAKSETETSLLRNACGFIVDECHAIGADTYQKVLSVCDGAIMRLGLTGTVPKDKVRRYKVMSQIGEVLYRISNEQLIEREISAKPLVFEIPIEEISVPDTDAMDGLQAYALEYEYGVVQSIERNVMISDIVKKETDAGKNVLILVERLEHGANIARTIQERNPNFRQGGSKTMFFTNGQETTQNQDLALEMLANGEIDCLIATSILDEGIDVSGVNALILARGGKSVRKLLQGIGRGLRKKPDGSNLHVYDFLDLYGKRIRAHSQERAKVMNGEKFAMALIEQDEYRNTPFDKLEEKVPEIT